MVSKSGKGPVAALESAAVSHGRRAPWWETVDDTVAAHLQLPAVDGADLPKEVDVAVLGGGIAGLSAAAAAAARGAHVVLLDQGSALGTGASGQNAGIVCVGVNMPITSLAMDAHAAWLWEETARLADWLFEECQEPDTLLSGRKTGSLFLAKSKTAAKRLEGEVRSRREAKLKAELISAADAKRMSSDWIDVTGVHNAEYLPDEGRINPWTLLAFLAHNARHSGALLLGGASIVRYAEVQEQPGRKRWQIDLANGMKVAARSLIRCTGPIVGANSRIYALSFRLRLPEDFPVFQDAAPFTYYDYRSGDGFFTVSGGRYGRAGFAAPDESYWRRMTAAARQWLPGIAAEPDYRWAVDLNVTADMIPSLTRLGTSAPGVAVEGLGALGVLPGIALGRKAAADMVSSLPGD
ncbi:MAG TPA: FAD-dependent oxidoreductase [Trichormus sp.]|jgi:glycine/D-amino acid oxidase-like deaminating enzyme